LGNSTASTAAVTVNASSTGANNLGIYGATNGNGTVTINTGANNKIAVSGDNSDGIKAFSTGGGSGVGGAVSITTLAGSDITVTPNSSVALESPAAFPRGFGIYAGNAGNDITINSASNISVTAGAGGQVFGITARIAGAVAGTGAINITSTGNISASGPGGATKGILANQTNVLDTGNVNVTSAAGTTITVSGNAAAPSYGIFAFTAGSGAVTVTAGGNLTSDGGGILTSATSGGTTINNSGSIKDLGTSNATAVLNIASSAAGNISAGTITINNNAAGVISSIGGLSSDLAIGATTAGTGAITINNAGRITGTLNLSGASSSTFNNTSALSWHTSGTSTFTNGNDVLTNSSSGLIATSGATTFAFLNGADNFTNAGTLIIGETAGASALTVTKGSGTMTMNNSGTIVMGSLNAGTTTDGQINDQFFAQASGTAFVASGGSRLMIDAFLGNGADQQTSCGSTPLTYAGFADCITIGASSGTGTRISVNDTNSAGSGAFNFSGTVMLDGTSGSAGDFFLSTSDGNVVLTPQGPAIVKGFTQYQLVFDATNANWDLVGLPTGAAFELSKITAGLQSLWYETADSWNERTSWVRYHYANGSMARGWSLWGKAYYGQINRDSENTLAVLGNSFTYDTSYRQNYGGLQIGGDFTVRDGNDGAWLFGVLAGYNTSNMDFAVGSDRTQISVVNLGAYASYMMGPLFADLLVKDDSTARIQEAHQLVIHVLCEIIEAQLDKT